MILNYLELVNLPGELFTRSRIANPREPENRRRIWAQSACDIYFIIFSYALHLLWAPAQRKRATMLYFANVLFIYLFIFMAALFSGPG